MSTFVESRGTILKRKTVNEDFDRYCVFGFLLFLFARPNSFPLGLMLGQFGFYVYIQCVCIGVFCSVRNYCCCGSRGLSLPSTAKPLADTG